LPTYSPTTTPTDSPALTTPPTAVLTNSPALTTPPTAVLTNSPTPQQSEQSTDYQEGTESNDDITTNEESSSGTLIIILSAALAVALCCVLLMFIYIKKRENIKAIQKGEEDAIVVMSDNHPSIYNNDIMMTSAVPNFNKVRSHSEGVPFTGNNHLDTENVVPDDRDVDIIADIDGNTLGGLGMGNDDDMVVGINEYGTKRGPGDDNDEINIKSDEFVIDDGITAAGNKEDKPLDQNESDESILEDDLETIM